MHIGAVLGGAPAWVYLLLAALIVLGVRRLRTRELPLLVALIPAVAFFTWSVIGASGFARIAGAEVAAFAWSAGAAFGAFSAFALPDAPAIRLPGRRVRQPGSPVPLVLYVTVFLARFACGAWAALNPEQAILAIGIGLTIGAAMTGRLVASILRWRSPEAMVATR